MPWAPWLASPLATLALVFVFVSFVGLAAIVGSGPVSASPGHGRHYWLVLAVEGGKSLVEVGGGAGLVRHEGGDCHLLGGQVNLVSVLEDLFISGFVERFSTYVCPYISRQLQGPQG